MRQNSSERNASRLEEPNPQFNADRRVYCLLGIPIDALSMKETLSELKRAVEGGRRCVWSTPNLNFLTSCLKSPEFRDILSQSQLSTVDGMPLVILSRLLGIPIKERVPGSSAFDELMKGAAGSLRVFFFGGPDGAAAKASRRLEQLSTLISSAGDHWPGFGSIESMSDPVTLEKINQSNADFLVLALNAKRGHVWINRNAEHLKVPIIAHLGSVINFVAGSVRRSPGWLQRFGLEWLWRIWEEPYLASRYRGDFVDLVCLMATRVFPLILLDPLLRFLASRGQERALNVERRPDQTVITLHGQASTAQIEDLRDALRRHAGDQDQLVVCLTNTTYINAELLGLLLILRGWRRQASLALLIIPPRKLLVRKLISLHCAGYLISP